MGERTNMSQNSRAGALLTFLSMFVFYPSSFEQQNLPAIVRRIEPAVVTIITYDDNGNLLSQGSGFFINKQGDVITNRHVLEGASQAKIKAHDGKEFRVNAILAEDKEW